MKTRFLFVAVACAALMVSAPLWGCTIAPQAVRVNSTHFVYPNSNVSPVGAGTASRSRLCGILMFGWNGFDHETTEGVIDEARLAAGGDLLINATVSTGMTMYGLFSLCKTAVAGTVAKMEVGKQELR